MTPREVAKRKVLAEWLRKADDDLALAEHLLAESASYPNAVAFHSQQAAEKYLKALLTWREIPFPKTHDLQVLLNLLGATDADLTAVLQDAVVLSAYGVVLRYPGDRPDATATEARDAATMAARVRKGVCCALPFA